MKAAWGNEKACLDIRHNAADRVRKATKPLSLVKLTSLSHYANIFILLKHTHGNMCMQASVFITNAIRYVYIA